MNTSEQMCGIYMITNKLNNKKYIGQSKHIFKRWYEHYLESIKDREINNTVIHKAIRANGIENFNFSIIEICEIDKLDEREKYYISLYNTTIENGGYNISHGGGVPNIAGEKNPSSKLTNSDVFEIREMYKNKISKREAYKNYSHIVSINTFADVWTGKTWNNIHMDVYTEVNKKYQKNNFDRIVNHVRSVSDNEILSIRNLYNEGNLSKSEVYNMFSYINPNTFNDIWYNRTFKNIQSNVINQRKKKIIRHVDQSGYNNPAAKFTKEEIIKIRDRRDNGELLDSVYEDYKQICTKQTFKNVWKEKTYKI